MRWCRSTRSSALLLHQITYEAIDRLHGRVGLRPRAHSLSGGDPASSDGVGQPLGGPGLDRHNACDRPPVLGDDDRVALLHPAHDAAGPVRQVAETYVLDGGVHDEIVS